MRSGWLKARWTGVALGILASVVFSGAAVAVEAEVLTVWAPGISTGTESIWDYVVAEFEKLHPGVDVQVTSPSDMQEKYIVAYAGGAGPDVGYMYNESMPGFVARGMLQPIDRFITPEDEENYYNLDYTEFMGERWGVPLFAGGRFLFYNAAQLEESGILPPETWEDFRAAANKLTRDGDGDGATDRWGTRFQYDGTSFGALNDSWDPWFVQAGGDWFTADGRRALINSDAGREALSFIHSLVHEDGSALIGGDAEAFFGGSLSMFYAGLYISSDRQQQAPNFDLGINVALRNKERGTWFATDYWGMFNSAKNPQLAWEWMTFSTSGPMMRYIHQYIVQLPVARDEGNPFPDDIAFQAVVPNMDLLHSRPIVPNGRQVFQVVFDNIRKAMHNEVPVNQALEEAERQANRLLEEGWRELLD